jgi:flagellin-like protein
MHPGVTDDSTDRGQSELIGTVLLIGIVLAGLTAIIVFGATALDSARDDSRVNNIEHSMTQFDSRAAMVALGNSNSQRVDLGETGDGRYDINPDSGWVNITHINHSGNGDVETITNATFGSVYYEHENTTISYQGGGVWRGTGNESIMISPPEFHYRGSTLTFPIISVNGTGGASGQPSAGIAVEERSRRIFPNASEPDYGNNSYQNPIDEGNVTVTIHGDHYVAWADYFEDRTSGAVWLDHENETASVNLIGFGTVGDFEMPAEGNSVEIQGLQEGHALTDFSVDLEVDKWNKLQWGFYASSGGRDFEIHVARQGGGNNCGDVDEIEVGVYYSNRTTDDYEGWQNQSVDVSEDPNFDVDCSEETLTADFAGDTMIEYDAIDTGGNSKWHYASSINDHSVVSPAVFDQHAADPSGSDGIYDASTDDKEELGLIVAHYFDLLGPGFELTTTDGPAKSNSIDEGASSGTLDYDREPGAGFVTFLHVTRNELRVDLGA